MEAGIKTMLEKLKSTFWIYFILVLAFVVGGLMENGSLGAFSKINYNEFVTTDQVISFDYANNYEVKRQDEVIYLRHLSTGVVAFQIFEKDDDFYYDPVDYRCKSGFCYSAKTPSRVLKNLSINPDAKPEYQLLSRGEALTRILKMRYPDQDFSEYAGECFDDINESTPNSGYICLAKREGIVVGIGTSYFPDNSINLWGLLKMLFVTYEVTDLDFDIEALDKDLFEFMTPYHFGYDVVAKAYYEGLFDNESGQDIWPNRHVYTAEADNIIKRFTEWQKGRKYKVYTIKNKFALRTQVYHRRNGLDLEFDEKLSEQIKNSHIKPTALKEGKEGVDIYYLNPGGIYEYVHTLKGFDLADIHNLVFSYDEDDFEMGIQLTLVGGETRHYELDGKKDSFAYIEKDKKFEFDDQNLLPNKADKPPNINAPEIKISMEEYGFDSIFRNRTVNQKYPALMEIVYPDGYSETFSVLIKTRGSGSRGFIKSSYTIESVTNLDAYDGFEGDEFLQDSDEIKLRSMISDDTLLREKIFYEAVEELGYPAPKSFYGLASINGVDLGLYQVTEAVEKEFFERRGIITDEYYYARNVSSAEKANLMLQTDSDTTVDLFKIKRDGEEENLLELIERLDENDPNLFSELNIQNIYEYAILTYMTNAFDSISSNYYLYKDKTTGTWNIFFWDADSQFGNMPTFTLNGFWEFARREPGTGENFNNLFFYVFRNIGWTSFESRYRTFKEKYEANVDMASHAREILNEYGELFKYDNALWNDKVLERMNPNVNSIEASEQLIRNIAGMTL